MTTGCKDWDPEAYARFRGLRLRPALDLMAQVPDLPFGDVIDLGCGDGAALPTLRRRCAGRIIGVDASPAMLKQAQGYDQQIEADIGTWQPDTPPALIFSNAALHWLPYHADLMPRLAGMLAPGGVLAVQMPRQFHSPSHRFLRDIAASLFPDHFDFAGYSAPVKPAESYFAMLQGLGQVTAWETDYIQRLEASEGHPVRAFTASTAMRPFVEKLSQAEADSLSLSYDAALGSAYPLQPDGSALMSFRRVFFVLQRP